MAIGRTIKELGLATILAGSMLSVMLYLLARTTLFITADYAWYDKIAALALLLAEAFTMLHAIGYFLNVMHVARDKTEAAVQPVDGDTLRDFPPIAVVVSSFREPLEIIEDTLICFHNLTYPNKNIYFLDDTRYGLPGADPDEDREYREAVDDLCQRIGVNLFRRHWRGAKAGMINDLLAFLDGNPPEGFEFQSFADRPRTETEKYILVFDADQNPLPDFAEDLVATMEHYSKLAFIQTPQYYSNFETNRVAKAAGQQQAIFYEYICEGKSRQDAMFCCGTNVIFRREALMDVGGFDESSVTEDFATSLKFHSKGWNSSYLNKVCAFGMGPEDLGGYFKQQFRWALGTVGLFRSILKSFFQNPGNLSPAKWWEYFLSGTHYFVGWVFFALMICPVLYLFGNVPSYFARPEIYLLFFTPYIILTVSLFAFTMTQRRYRLKELALGIVLQALCFPVYMKASLLGIIGFRGTFGITPKGGSLSLPLHSLWPQIFMAMLCCAAISWGGMRLFFHDGPWPAILANGWWCFYHLLIMSTVFYFNSPEVTRK